MALENLTVDLDLDPDGIRAGFEQALQMVNNFAREATNIVSRADLVPGGLESGERAAVEMVRGLRTGFEQSQAQTRELFFRGLISRGEMDTLGKTAAADFNHGILDGINKLAGSGMLTKRLRVELVNELKSAGLEAGEALRGQLANKLVETGSHFETFGEKGLRASQRVAFGLQAIAEGGTKAEHGLKGILEAGSSFAGLFGGGGIVVAALAAGALAIYNYFSKAREEMEKTREKFVNEVNNLINAGDRLGIMSKLREVQQGTLSGDNPGLNELRRQRKEIEDWLRSQPPIVTSAQMGAGQGGVLKDSPLGRLITIRTEALNVLRPKVAALVEQERALIRAINAPPEARRDITGITTTITAPSDERAKRDAESAAAKALRASEKAARDFAAELRGVAEAAKLSGTGADFIEGINERLVASYNKVTDAINKQKDAFSPYAVELRKIRDELEKAPIIQMLNGTLMPPSPTITPNAPLGESPLRGPRSTEVRELPTLNYSKAQFALDTFTNHLTATGKSIRDGFHNTVGQSLAVFTPLGAAMTVFGGIVEGLTPLLDALKEPLRIVGEILGKALAPILKALFPVFKAVAIAATYVGEIFLKVSSVISIGIGSLLKGIGNLLNKLPGSIGNPLKKAGQGLIDFGEAQREAADALRKGRDELRNLEWNDALDSVTNAANDAAEALRNVPIGWNAALAAFEAGKTNGGQQPAGAPPPPSSPSDPTNFPAPGDGGGSGGGSGGVGGGGRPGQGTVPTTIIQVESVVIGDNLTPKQQAKMFVGELMEIASDQYGNSSRWPEVRV